MSFAVPSRRALGHVTASGSWVGPRSTTAAGIYLAAICYHLTWNRAAGGLADIGKLQTVGT
jgi:hypothetical protein